MTRFISDSSFVSSPHPSLSSLLPSHMSFSTDFQPIFHCTGDHHYDHIYASYPEPHQDCARAEIARLERSLIVPDTGGEGSFTQWVHCEFVVSFEAFRPVITQEVCGEFF